MPIDAPDDVVRSRQAHAYWLVLCLSAAPAAFGACQISKLAELPVTLVGNRPVMQGQVNGRAVEILVDTGSTSSFIGENEAKALGLRTTSLQGVSSYGVGGETRISATVLQEFKFGAFEGKNLPITVVGSQPGRKHAFAQLVLGEDFFSNFTTEFDFAHGVIRLLRLQGCKFDQVAYWSDQFSMAELSRADPGRARIQTDVNVNGKEVDAILDTGAATSIISVPASRSAGVNPGQDGTQTIGTVTGLAGNPIEAWIGTFGTFALGDERVRNVKLRIADLFAADSRQRTGSHVRKNLDDMPEMLVGADFFRTHRILVLFEQRKLVFTYNGGLIFQTTEPNAASKIDAGADTKKDEPTSPGELNAPK